MDEEKLKQTKQLKLLFDSNNGNDEDDDGNLEYDDANDYDMRDVKKQEKLKNKKLKGKK